MLFTFGRLDLNALIRNTWLSRADEDVEVEAVAAAADVESTPPPTYTDLERSRESTLVNAFTEFLLAIAAAAAVFEAAGVLVEAVAIMTN
jgi:hypothetical protein